MSRHNKILINEMSKAHPNSCVVKELMEKSFSMRRQDIMDNPCDITTLLVKYPYLSEQDQVVVIVMYMCMKVFTQILNEMCCILKVNSLRQQK